MLKFKLIFLLLLIPSVAFATPPTRQFNYVPNATIDPNQNNTNENALYSYLQTGVDTYTPGSISAASINANASISYSQLSLTGSIQKSDLASSVQFVLPSGAIFYMLTGSCPSGTTDVSATYANKFIKVNSTQGTSSGVILTGTTDSHILGITEIPSHSHTIPVQNNITPGAGQKIPSYSPNNVASDSNATSNTGSAGGGLGHTHTISGATTLEPSSITAKLCQVN